METAVRAITWLFCIICIGSVSTQELSSEPFKKNDICKDMFCNSMSSLRRLQECAVVLGNLQVLLLEWTSREELVNVSFPRLREVTGYVVVYRVPPLESLGQLFPGLARIRGRQLLNDFALVVHDMDNLKEIGLYSLLKIDRGGVIVWAAPKICFVNTIEWQSIAPRARHVLTASGQHDCSNTCTCSRQPRANRCWNIRKCQRFLEGPEADKCNEQCLGCRKTNPEQCTLCRHHTHRGRCVPRCPPHTVVLPENNYCLTEKECGKLGGWVWADTCVFKCPVNYKKKNLTKNGVATCTPCFRCDKTCQSQLIRTLDTIQAAERCVYINGSLTIHVRAIPKGMQEMRQYLSRIEVVTDYILIFGSISITSLDFLPSLRSIGGNKLLYSKYSLVINDMLNLQTLFPPNVTKNLSVARGTLSMYHNPMLCMSKIEQLKAKFPVEPSTIDIPPGMNGYSGGCAEVSVGPQIRVINETSAIVMFSPVADPDVYYSLLYVRLPPCSCAHETFVPETCSESEWNAVHVSVSFGDVGWVELTALRPASVYAICIETYDPVHRNLARSTIVNFTTPVGKPESPFIMELVASSSDVVVIRWVNHKDYGKYITRYELDVHIIDIYTKDVFAKDHCREKEEELDVDYFRHARVRRPPPQYHRGCESKCGILSTVTAGAMVEENFDVCESLASGCDQYEYDPPGNLTVDNYVQSVVLNINRQTNDFQVGGLAPYRDYRFRLRACVRDQCSGSTRGIVRTLPTDKGDIPSVVSLKINNTGHISVQWRPPDVTNGPVLSYSVQVLPKIKVNEVSYILPQSWCVLADQLSLTVRSEKASVYLVRVCSSTLASTNACSDWRKVTIDKELQYNWLWTALLFGIILYFLSLGIGYIYRQKVSYDPDNAMLLEENIQRNESEPPIFMSSDLAPLYNVPLSETVA